MASKGLQILYPLAPDLMLIMYDPKVYKVGNKKQFSNILVNEKDVESLNILTCLHGNKSLYASDRVSDYQFENIIKKFGTEGIEEILIELLVHKQKNILYKLFSNKDFGEELKERYTVLYFVASLLVKPENKTIELSIPPEIKETVDDVIDYIEERQEFYGYK